MKKVFSLIAMLFVVTLLQAQTGDDASIPRDVRVKFAQMYPNVRNFNWEKDGANYEANFEEDNFEETVSFDANGKFLQSEEVISVNKLPKAATDYLAKNVPGKKIKEVSEITNAEGVITYEVEVKNVEYNFDANGNFLK